MKQRVQKIIAASGFCSRRRAEDFIKDGKVTVNGQKITLGDQADQDKDQIMVGKQAIIIAKHLYLMLHKPSGYITTKSDLWDRRNVMELLKGIDRSVYPVGRLDRDARGLLLLSSDGDFAQHIMHPRNQTTKTYQATLDKPLHKETMEHVRQGVVVEGRRVQARIKKIKPKLVEITIHEGRNKIVKKYCKALGYYVKDLKRVAIGPVRLNIPEGAFRELTEKEKAALLAPPTNKQPTSSASSRPSSRSSAPRGGSRARQPQSSPRPSARISPRKTSGARERRGSARRTR